MKQFCLLLFSALLVVSSCRRQEYSPAGDWGNVIRMSVSLEKDEILQSDSTRVSMSDGSALAWDGNESVGVIFSKSSGSTTTYRYTQELKTRKGCPGVFEGDVDLGTFSVSDIVGIVCPYNENSWGKYHTSSGRRIVMQVGTTDQIQAESGKFPGGNITLFTPVSISDFVQKDGVYVLSGRKLKWGCSLFKFNVYGRNGKSVSGEKVEAVEAFATTTICQAGTAEWNISTQKFSFVGETTHPHIWVSLATPASFGTTAGSAASLYASTLPRGDNGNTVKYTGIFVITDKAVYEKVIDRDVSLKSGCVNEIDLNLSTFERTSRTFVSSGYDSVMFIGYEPLKFRPVKIYYNIPSGFNKSSMPVLFAMHGNGRAARSTLGNVKTASNKKGFIALAPLFTKSLYSSKFYHLGGVSSSTSAYEPVEKERWTYNIIESAFDFMKEQTGNTSTEYDIWGHSAGSQFVHRFLLNMPEARVDRAVSSNAGYYTVPDPKGISNGKTSFGFPYSVKDMSMPASQLKKYFARNMTVHLGTADTATTVEEDPDLPVSDGAKAQGACRYERGQFFYNRAKAVADSLGYPFNWQLVKVSGVAHSSGKMAQNSTNGALVLLYGK